MMPRELKERQTKLQRALATLSGGVEILATENRGTRHNPGLCLKGNVRIPKGKLRLSVWEEFRQLDSTPILHAFSYHVAEEADIGIANPIIRFECHPDLDENEEANSQNPYAISPHFHPDLASRSPFDKLHYPFHRSERNGIIFGLVEWMKVDLLKRFYS